MKEIFMTAVYIGAKTGRHRPLDSKRVSPFKGNILSDDEQNFLRALSIGHTENPEIIMDPQKVVRIAEEYANAGIWELEKILNTSAEGPLWDLADYYARELSG
jgi:hypothetical protein